MELSIVRQAFAPMFELRQMTIPPEATNPLWDVCAG